MRRVLLFVFGFILLIGAAYMASHIADTVTHPQQPRQINGSVTSLG